MTKLFYTIIIPTYNRSLALVRCLDSLVKQTFKNFEVIVCDDASTDDTKNQVKQFYDKLNLEYICLETNFGGPARPRNIGLENANGEWICFLDSDDWYATNRLEIISKLDLQSIDFLYHNTQTVKDNKFLHLVTTRQLDNANAYYDLLFGLNAISTSTTCIRKSIIQGKKIAEDKEIIGLEDFDFWIQIAMNNARFYYLNETLSYYTFGEDNITFYDERQSNRFKALYQPYIDAEKNKFFKNKIDAALSYLIANQMIRCGNIKEGLLLAQKSLIYGNIRIKLRSIKAILLSLKKTIKL